VNEILTCYCGSHTFELCHIFKGFISYLNIMISSDDVTWTYTLYLSLLNASQGNQYIFHKVRPPPEVIILASLTDVCQLFILCFLLFFVI
jgi:hypothetical protein